MLIVSKTAQISKLADIEDSVRGTKIVIGDNVTIDSFVKIKCVGGLNDIIIGENSRINSNCVLFSGNGSTIGKDVLIAPCCVIVPTNHAYENANKTIIEQRFKASKGGIIIVFQNL